MNEPRALLSRLVDALAVGAPGLPACAELVQKNEADAVVLLGDVPVVLLAEPAEARLPWLLDAAFERERKAVLLGLKGTAAVVLWIGGEPVDLPKLPALHERLGLLLGHLRVGDSGELEGANVKPAGEQDKPAHAVLSVAPRLRAALGAVVLDQVPAATAEALAASERAGEHALAAEGLFTLRIEKQLLVVYGILAGLAALCAVQWICGGLSDDLVLARLGSSRGFEVREGQVWLLFTAGWLHAGPVHLMSNAVGLLYFGIPIAAALGGARTFSLFAIGCASGFALAAWKNPAEDGVGASGGIFALMTALLVLSIRSAEHVPRRSRKGWLIFSVVFLVINLVASLRPGVSVLGHLGGAVAGLVLAASGLLTAGLPELDSGRAQSGFARFASRAVAALLLGVTLGSLTIAARHGRPWEVRYPPPLVTARLLPTPFQLEIPESLATRFQVTEGEVPHFTLGTGRTDPILVSVLVRPRSGADVAALLAAATARGPSKDTKWRSPPRALELPDRAAVFLDQISTGNEEHELPRFVVADGDLELDVQASIHPDANARWRRAAREVPRSIARSP